MRIFYQLSIALVIGAFVAEAQPTDWSKLSQVTFVSSFDENWGMEVKKPVFSGSVMSLQGKEVVLDGYIYPLEGKKASSYFVLSALPLSSCFFCGKGGPETVVEVNAQKPIPYTDKKIVLKGKLLVKDADPQGIIYSLQEAFLLTR